MTIRMVYKRKSNGNNDFAVAKALNESVMSLFDVLMMYQIIVRHERFDKDEINRAYIFLIDDLQKIYDKNPELQNIEPEPTWKKFDLLIPMYDVSKYLEDNDGGKSHNARVEKLCILAGEEEPNLTEDQKKLVEYVDTVVAKYLGIVIEEHEKAPKEEVDMPLFYIPKFTFTYKQDCTVLINDVLKLKKVHAGSISEHLLEQCMKNPNKLFKPKLGRTSRNISTILSSIGITPIMRDLFFSIVSDEKGVLFRPTVTFREALNNRIRTREFEKELMKHGAIPHLVTPEIYEPTTDEVNQSLY